jgi:hypothetical protein
MAAEIKRGNFMCPDLDRVISSLNEKAVRGAMQHLLHLDFIEYNEIGVAEYFLKEKALHFVRSKNNRKDYDDLDDPFTFCR